MMDFMLVVLTNRHFLTAKICRQIRCCLLLKSCSSHNVKREGFWESGVGEFFRLMANGVWTRIRAYNKLGEAWPPQIGN